MADELNDIQNTVHEYRKSLEAFERRTGAAPQAIEVRGSGEEREKIARIDADLDAAERLMQLRSMQQRLAKLEATPEFETRAPKADGLATDGKDYAQRWLKALASGNPMEMRALALTSSGAAVPTDMERRIINKLQQANVLRRMATVSTIDSKRTISVEGNLPTTNLVAEAGTITPSDPTFGTAISVVPYKYVCATTMSQEFIEDAIGNGGIGSGLDYVADKIGMSIALKEEEAFTIGTGSSQPEGVAGSAAQTALAALSQVTDLAGAAVTTVTGDNLIDTVHLVPPQYRNSPRFSWLISDTFLKTVRKIKVNTTDYVWKVGNEGGIANGVPGTIYGVPYQLGQYVRTATTNNNIFAVVGDFSYFEIFDRTGITSLLDPYSAASTHSVTLYVYKRLDSHVMNYSAFAAITC